MDVKGLTYIKGSLTHNIVKMMMCTHADTRDDSHDTICNDCGILLNIDAMTAAIANALDAESRRVATETLGLGRAYTVCNHTTKDTGDDGIPFCIGCGLMFEDEKVYSPEVYNEAHNAVYDKIPDKVHDKIYNDVYDEGRRHCLRTPTDVGSGVETTLKDVDEIIPRTVEDLRTIAKARGIKGSKSMSKKTLCEILGLEIVKPDKLAFKNKDTGEEHRFKSIYRASKDMNVNPGLIQYYMDTGGVITIDGIKYNIYNTQTGTV